MNSLITKSAILALASAVTHVEAAMGNSFGTGPVSNGSFIRVANSTLVVPNVPSPRVGLLSLWTGMGTQKTSGDGDLIQALVESYEGDIDQQCGVLSDGEWCAWSSALVPSGQIGGDQVITKPGDHVTMSYIYNDDEDMYDQTVLVNGVVVSTLKTSSGKAIGWGTAEECQPQYPCGIIPQHDWINTVLVMDQLDPDYSKTFYPNNATGTLTTADGGKTWTGPKLTIGEVDFNYTVPSNTEKTNLPKCPSWNKKTYTSDSGLGRNYKIQCGIDYPNADLGMVRIYTNSIADCIIYCERKTGCVGISMSGTACYLKKNVGHPKSRAGVRSAILIK